MNAEHDPLAARLADYDDALAAGRIPDTDLPAGADRERWDRAVAVVELLRRVGPAAVEREPPRRIGRYSIERELGRGGMGVVYAAFDPDLGRRVAVKVLHEPDADRAARLRNEAAALARLRHPGIVQVFEVGSHEGQPYLVLELVHGEPPRVNSEHPLTPTEAARLMVQVAHAIAHAHGQGVVHRDLKPSNVLLDSDGRARVTDFGLAKSTEANLDLTRTGAALGTPNYMAPEQASSSGDRSGTAVDVYGLGATLFALLTGRPPFVGLTAFDVMTQVVADDVPPVRLFQPGVPLDLDTVCRKCLEKDPRRRYASAAAVADDLERFLAGKPVLARPVSSLEKFRRMCGRNRALTALVVGLLAVLTVGIVATSLLAAWALHSRDEATDQADIARTVRDFLQFDMIDQADPSRQERDGFKVDYNLTLREALDRATPKIAARCAGKPRLEAAIRLSIGQAYLGVNQPEKAVPHLTECVRLLRAVRGPDHEDLLDPLTALVMAHNMLAKRDEGLPHQRDLYRLRQRHLGRDAVLTLEAGHSLCMAEFGNDEPATARARLEELLALARARHGRYSGPACDILVSLVLSLPGLGPTKDNPYFQELLAVPPEDVPDLVHHDRGGRPHRGMQFGMLVETFLGEDRPDRARLYLDARLNGMRAEPALPAFLCEELRSTGQVCHHWGQFALGAAYLREADALFVKLFAPDAAPRLETLEMLAECLLFAGDAAEAEPITRHLVEARKTATDITVVGRAMLLRGWCLLQRGELIEAELHLDLARLTDPKTPSDAVRAARARTLYGQWLLASNRAAEAEVECLGAYADLKRLTAQPGPRRHDAYRRAGRDALVALYEKLGQGDKARALKAEP